MRKRDLKKRILREQLNRWKVEKEGSDLVFISPEGERYIILDRYISRDITNKEIILEITDDILDQALENELGKLWVIRRGEEFLEFLDTEDVFPKKLYYSQLLEKMKRKDLKELLKIVYEDYIFNEWYSEIKYEYPDSTDDEIEEVLDYELDKLVSELMAGLSGVLQGYGVDVVNDILEYLETDKDVLKELGYQDYETFINDVVVGKIISKKENQGEWLWRIIRRETGFEPQLDFIVFMGETGELLFVHKEND